MADTRKSAKEADYEELLAARKDADCKEVYVHGGVSSDRGCCCLWKRSSRYAKDFSCGTCRYITGKK